MEEKNLPIVLYTAPDGTTQIDVKLDGETVWLSQQQMSLVFQTDRTSILRHISNIYKTGELERNSTCAKIAQVRIEGKRKVSREIPFYNLDMSRSDSDDCRIKDRGERCDGKSCGKSY